MSSWLRKILCIDKFISKFQKLNNNTGNEDTETEKGEFIWCLVGNIIEKHYYGEDKQLKIGTKQFSPNTKVYCYPALWGDGYENIKVIGRPRSSQKFITVIVKAKYIKNWRLQKVYHPYIIKKMKESEGWDNTERSQKEISAMVKWLPERTEEVKD